MAEELARLYMCLNPLCKYAKSKGKEGAERGTITGRCASCQDKMYRVPIGIDPAHNKEETLTSAYEEMLQLKANKKLR